MSRVEGAFAIVAASAKELGQLALGATSLPGSCLQNFQRRRTTVMMFLQAAGSGLASTCMHGAYGYYRFAFGTKDNSSAVLVQLTPPITSPACFIQNIAELQLTFLPRLQVPQKLCRTMENDALKRECGR